MMISRDGKGSEYKEVEWDIVGEKQLPNFDKTYTVVAYDQDGRECKIVDNPLHGFVQMGIATNKLEKQGRFWLDAAMKAAITDPPKFKKQETVQPLSGYSAQLRPPLFVTSVSYDHAKGKWWYGLYSTQHTIKAEGVHMYIPEHDLVAAS